MAKYEHAPWLYNGQPFTEVPKGVVAFVYLLTEVETGKQYIGKKSFVSVSTTEVNGRKKNTKRESDWQKYYSSNLEIMAKVGVELRADARDALAIFGDRATRLNQLADFICHRQF